jgi:hypothetical protein
MFALSAGIAASVCFAVLLGTASDSRRVPLDGVWRAEFLADTDRDVREPISRPQSVHGTFSFRPARYSGVSWDIRLWVTVFEGDHPLHFRPITGESGADDGHVSAGRIGPDSVLIGFGQCDDCGSIYGRARIVADTIAGVWRTSSWGKGTSGTFRLVRVGQPAT